MTEYTLYLMNAAGHIKGPGPSFEKLLRAPVDEITVGSITVLERPGNNGTNFVVLPDGTAVNSLGLNNMGARRARDEIPTMVQRAHDRGKRLRLSVAPLDYQDLSILAQLAIDCGAHTLELNLGCPNIWQDGRRKRVLAYDPAAVAIAVKDVLEVIHRGHASLPLAVKLSPYETPQEAQEIAGLMGELLVRNNDSVVLCNTLPDYSPKGNDGKALLRAVAPDGSLIETGGMSGTALKARALSVVKIFNEELPPHIMIDAAGGIQTGQDAYDYFQVGARRFQVGTAYFATDNPKIFEDIIREFYE